MLWPAGPVTTELSHLLRSQIRGHPHEHRIPWNDVDTFDGSTVRLKTKG
jgi:hypothetical protein